MPTGRPDVGRRLATLRNRNDSPRSGTVCPLSRRAGEGGPMAPFFRQWLAFRSCHLDLRQTPFEDIDPPLHRLDFIQQLANLFGPFSG